MTRSLTAASTVAQTAKPVTIGLIAGTLGAIGLIEGGSGGIWPDVLNHFSLSDSALGPGFALQSAFVLPVLLFGGKLLRRFGIRVMLVVGALLMGLASFGFARLDQAALFFGLFMIRGIGVALADLSGNTMAMHVEREDGVHIMGIVHGGFSVGIVIGSLVAYAIYSSGGSFRAVQLSIVVAIGLIALAAAAGPVPPIDEADVADQFTTAAFRLNLVRICALLLGLAFGGELLISQFVSVLLRTRTESSESFAVLSVVVYATMMAIGRFANGPLLRRVDAIRLLTMQGAGVVIGGLVLTASPNAGVTLVGSFIGGLAIAGIVPSVLSYAAAHSPGSAGETAGASLLGGYLGGMVVPLVAGGLTSLFSIRAGISLVAIAGALTVILANALRRDEHREQRDGTLPGTARIS